MTDRTPFTDQQLDDIEARANAATPGPWSTHENWPGRVFSEDSGYGHVARCTGSRGEADAEFIARARQDVDQLVAEVRRLRAELAAVVAVHEKGEHSGLAICLHCASQMFPPPETGIWSESAWPCATLRALGVTEDQPAARPVVSPTA